MKHRQLFQFSISFDPYTFNPSYTRWVKNYSKFISKIYRCTVAWKDNIPASTCSSSYDTIQNVTRCTCTIHGMTFAFRSFRLSFSVFSSSYLTLSLFQSSSRYGVRDVASWTFHRFDRIARLVPRCRKLNSFSLSSPFSTISAVSWPFSRRSSWSIVVWQGFRITRTSRRTRFVGKIT